MEADPVEEIGAGDAGHVSADINLPGADDEAESFEEETSCDKSDSSETGKEELPGYIFAESMDVMTESGIEMEPSDDEDIGDTSHFDAEERNQLFARGLMQEKEGKMDAALKCYLGCLSGLSRETRFVLLPQCLRNIAEIYYANQEYEKAIHFVQAEKLYYENALINTEEIQKKLEELHLTQESGDASTSRDARTVETLQAEEYEHLAKLCMDRSQPQLALEYAGKCTKLRQQLFGEHHPKTQESLDYFASLYAEVGKQQYTDSMETLDRQPEVGTQQEVGTPDSESSAPVTPTEGSPVSILRHRKNSDKERKQVRFHASVVDNHLHQEREELISRHLLVVLLSVCFLCLFTLGLGLYCRLASSSPCESITAFIHNAYIQLRFQYYKYTSTKHVKFA